MCAGGGRRSLGAVYSAGLFKALIVSLTWVLGVITVLAANRRSVQRLLGLVAQTAPVSDSCEVVVVNAD
jgi:hypothetical protein